MTELKPCPFCGAELEYLFYTLDHNQGGKWGFAQCPCCGASAGEVRTSYDQSENAPWHEDALKEWNTRHIPEGHVTKAHMDERIVQAVAAARKAWAQQATIPEGYALVPIEPTQRMLDAAQTAVNVGDAWTHKGVYKAMIEAAREEE